MKLWGEDDLNTKLASQMLRCSLLFSEILALTHQESEQQGFIEVSWSIWILFPPKRLEGSVHQLACVVDPLTFIGINPSSFPENL
jgi:hypothetical protein